MSARLVLLALVLVACGTTGQPENAAGSTTPPTPSTTAAVATSSPPDDIRVGAAVAAATDFEAWNGARVGLIAHGASLVDGTHTADLLDSSEHVDLVALFGPEHGLRGTADAGEEVADSIDATTGVPVFSLFGETRAPTEDMLTGLDVLFYDLQDVGVRYYTYISTMGLAMQAAATHDVAFVVLDRPNPLGPHVGGAVRAPDQASFVGLYPIAERYGLTPGELAETIVAEAWIDGVADLDLTVVPLEGWTGSAGWPDALAWEPPSPAITSPETALLYPATVLLEATTVSLGRGTTSPFEVVGAPGLDQETLLARLDAAALPGVAFEPVTFTPSGRHTISVPPIHEGVELLGVRLVVTDDEAIRPTEVGLHLLDAVIELGGMAVVDRPTWLDRLSGSTALRLALEAGDPATSLLDHRRESAREFAALVEPHRRYQALTSR